MPTCRPTADRTGPASVLFAHVLLPLAPLFMASNVVIGRAAAEAVSPVELAFWRWVAAFLILLPFAGRGLVRHHRTLIAEWPALLLLGALGMGASGAFVYIGLKETSATN